MTTGYPDPRAVLAYGRGLAALTGQVVGHEKRLRRHVADSYAALRDRMVRRELAAIPVERLRETTEGRLRLGKLAAAGFTTVLSVYQADQRQLDALPGVGPATATQAVAAARQLAAAVEDSLKLRIDLDPGDEVSTALLVGLHRLGELDAALARVREPAGQLARELPDVLAAAPLAAAGRLRRFLAGRTRRERADRAFARLAQLLAWADGERVTADLRRAEDIGLRPYASPAEVWKDFERRSPEYYGLLGEVVGVRVDVAAAEGSLPTEIAEQVRAQQLDATFCRVSLRGYQSFGARFALVQRRVIVGDEMGLGKTIQAIAAMAHLRALGSSHFLVVCPASVLVNWTRELAARSALASHRVHGADRDADLARWVRSGGVAVTTFDSLRSLAAPADLLADAPLGMLVVDEAHFVKNPRAQRSRAVKEWADQAERVLFLTGTPMENHLAEFRSLVTYLQPAITDRMDSVEAIVAPAAFRRAVAPVYLRRNQEDVLGELPDLVRTDEWVEFGPADLDAYRDAVAEGNFMAMRRAAYRAGLPGSAKLRRLHEILGDAAENGRKVVVFSYFREVLDVVAASVGPAVFGPLTGSVPAGERAAMVDRFSQVDGHAVLVSQIQAGGVGMNMQAASVAVLCEPQVKPAAEEQAVARLHRMGQVRTVRVHRLLAVDSVDERMLEILDDKARAFDRYARQSEVAEATPDAVDVSDVALARQIVQAEQERLAMEAIRAQEAAAQAPPTAGAPADTPPADAVPDHVADRVSQPD